MSARITILWATCALSFGCQRAEVRQQERLTDRNLEEQHAEWAARQPRPSEQVVSRIETLLTQDPCVGPLDRWERIYAYNENIQSKTLYPGIIDFHLNEAGGFGVRPGRHITEPNSWVNVDDRPIRMVSGDYQVSTGKLSIGFCGNNVGPSPEPTAIDRFDEYYDELKARQARERGIQTG
jgi:hypothetical protein